MQTKTRPLYTSMMRGEAATSPWTAFSPTEHQSLPCASTPAMTLSSQLTPKVSCHCFGHSLLPQHCLNISTSDPSALNNSRFPQSLFSPPPAAFSGMMRHTSKNLCCCRRSSAIACTRSHAARLACATTGDSLPKHVYHCYALLACKSNTIHCAMKAAYAQG